MEKAQSQGQMLRDRSFRAGRETLAKGCQPHVPVECCRKAEVPRMPCFHLLHISVMLFISIMSHMRRMAYGTWHMAYGLGT